VSPSNQVTVVVNTKNKHVHISLYGGQLKTVEMETENGNGKRKQSKLDPNEC